MGANHNHSDQYLKNADLLAWNYMADGIIYYTVGDERDQGSGKVCEIMARLEKETGIDFERVDPITGQAEINLNYKPDVVVNGNTYAGVAYVSAPMGKSYVEVDQDTWHWEGTMVHEIGHALGLAHDHETSESIMSYNRDYRMTWFQEQDMDALSNLYGSLV